MPLSDGTKCHTIVRCQVLHFSRTWQLDRGTSPMLAGLLAGWSGCCAGPPPPGGGTVNLTSTWGWQRFFSLWVTFFDHAKIQCCYCFCFFTQFIPTITITTITIQSNAMQVYNSQFTQLNQTLLCDVAYKICFESTMALHVALLHISVAFYFTMALRSLWVLQRVATILSWQFWMKTLSHLAIVI